MIEQEMIENNGKKNSESIKIDETTVIFGKDGLLDSHGLVSVIILIEEIVSEKYGYHISITDERALIQEKSPFQTVGRLSEYIRKLIEEPS